MASSMESSTGHDSPLPWPLFFILLLAVCVRRIPRRQEKWHAMSRVRVGSKVRHRAQFLRSVGWYTNVRRNGIVMALERLSPHSDTVLAEVGWSEFTDSTPARVNVANLEVCR